MSKLIVLDGNSLVNRAFYAIPLLTTQRGVFTNAAYGFTNMLFRIIEEQKPCHLAVAFDKTKAHRRIAQYAEYKGNRKPTPDELRSQFPLIKDILQVLDIPVIECEGYEADDLIGALVRKAEARGWNCLIYTGDRDSYQLISAKTMVAFTKKGISEVDLVDEQGLWDKYNLKPEQIPDLKGLMGDSSDNIPGVPGIGEKTALKLLWDFGTVENLLANTECVKGKKVQTNLREYADQARLSKKLATIDTDAPVDIDIENCALTEPDYPKLLELFKELEFKNLIKTVTERLNLKPDVLKAIPTGFTEPQAVVEIVSLEQLKEFVAGLTPPIAVYCEYTAENPRHGEFSGIGLAGTGGVCGYLSGDTLADKAIMAVVAALLGNEMPKATYDLKKLYQFCLAQKIDLRGVEADLMLAAYLLNPLKGKYGLEEIAFDYLNLTLDVETGYLGIRAAVIQQLALTFQGKLAEMELLPLLNEVELPLAKVLAKMELTGVSVDRTKLEEMGDQLKKRLDQLETEIYDLAGEHFNINSTQQLGVILFEKLKLPVIKKTKTGYSTDAAVLERLAPEHPMIEKLLEYRQLAKLNSTYIEGLKSIQDRVTGKVHTSFNQTITATGRLSSTEPNLQNIPIRLELGRRVRKAFVPAEPDMVILSADYSQIELRILAHISGDESLLESFRKEEDIHTRTASEIFGIPLDEVTSEMRRRAKAVNFGIVYGISDFGLSRDVGVSKREAKEYIDNYFARYPGVRKYIDNVIAEARTNGYVTTVYKRRRNLPDLFSSNRMKQAFGERTAMNTPIQGSAADIIKLAMVKIDEALRGYRTRMLLQVHDELIFEVPQDELPQIKELVRTTMETALPLSVRLKVDMKSGPDWYNLSPLA